MGKRRRLAPHKRRKASDRAKRAKVIRKRKRLVGHFSEYIQSRLKQESFARQILLPIPISDREEINATT
jgi:hypothetical protein